MSDQIDNAFHVPLSTHLLSGCVHRRPRFWVRLGNMESWILREKLQETTVDHPIYVAGLARSGSTILLEFLAAHPQVATHQYRDFPLVLTPYWCGKAHKWSLKSSAPVERAHKDGIMVTPASPEAMEEMVWMAFFPDAHNPEVSQALDADLDRPDFEHFYRDHVRKMLLTREKKRYVSKGNYNFTRFPYLLKLFPDARFVVPIRHPLNHIASLMKQQRLFAEGEAMHPRALEHMRRVGHYEFGLDRRPINIGNTDAAREIIDLWERGEEVRGWARYWAYLHEWFADCLDRDEKLREAVMVVRYEDLCADPRGMLDRLLAHCHLEDDALAASFAERIQAPTYYRPKFSTEEEEIILEETRSAAERFGYANTTQEPLVQPLPLNREVVRSC